MYNLYGKNYFFKLGYILKFSIANNLITSQTLNTISLQPDCVNL